MDGPLKVKTAELIKIYAFNTYSINSKVEIKFDCKVYSSFLVNFSELDVSNTIKAIKTAENCTEEDIAFGKDYNSQKVWKILSKYWPKKQTNKQLQNTILQRKIIHHLWKLFQGRTCCWDFAKLISRSSTIKCGVGAGYGILSD